MTNHDYASTLSSVKGFLIDLDGTIYVGDRLIPGAKEFIHKLRERNVPHAFVTNITSRPRSQVLSRIQRKGLEIEAEQVLTAPIATKQYLDRNAIGPCYFLTRPTLIEDFVGHPQNEDDAEAVVVGDMGPTVTFQHLNRAFRLLLDGAKFVTMSRSKSFREADGMSLDAGAFVALLEYASERGAVVTGKPSQEFFQSGLDLIGLQANEVAMIGDDLTTDVRGAQECGVRGFLVLSGKTRQYSPAATGKDPDMILDGGAELINAL